MDRLEEIKKCNHIHGYNTAEDMEWLIHEVERLREVEKSYYALRIEAGNLADKCDYQRRHRKWALMKARFGVEK